MKSFLLNKSLLTLAALVLMAAMIKLGFWQLQRSKQKLEHQQLYNQRIQEPVKLLSTIKAKDSLYSRVSIIGKFMSEQGFLVDNVVHSGQVGVNVVTPIKLDGLEGLILVNRGWLAWGSDRRFLPEITTPSGELLLTGVIIPAVNNHFYLKNPESFSKNAALWPQLDVNRFEKRSKWPVGKFIFVLDSNQPGSYQHIWGLSHDTWILRHKAYAVQWFALAGSLFIIYCVLSYRYWLKPKT